MACSKLLSDMVYLLVCNGGTVALFYTEGVYKAVFFG